MGDEAMQGPSGGCDMWRYSATGGLQVTSCCMTESQSKLRDLLRHHSVAIIVSPIISCTDKFLELAPMTNRGVQGRMSAIVQ